MKIQRGGNGLLLIELFIALMFFSLAAAICLQIFIGAHNFSEEASDKSRAAIESQNIAECFKAAAGDVDELARLLGTEANGGAFELWFDSSWNRVPQDGEFLASFKMTGEADGLHEASLQISQADKTLISYDIAAVEVTR